MTEIAKHEETDALVEAKRSQRLLMRIGAVLGLTAATAALGYVAKPLYIDTAEEAFAGRYTDAGKCLEWTLYYPGDETDITLNDGILRVHTDSENIFTGEGVPDIAFHAHENFLGSVVIDRPTEETIPILEDNGC